MRGYRRWGLIFLMAVLLPLKAQSPGEEPLWLVMERGRRAVRQGELGEALTIFRGALGRSRKMGRPLPEAELWMGYIFEEEGEWQLAEKQYLESLEHKDFLYNLEDVFTILHRLARIYENSSQYGSYEASLKKILELDRQDPGKIDPGVVAREEAMYRLFVREGMDKLFTLYREDEKKYQLAHQKLGVFSYRTGLYRESILYLLKALISPVTNLVDFQMKEDPGYEFTAMAALLPSALEEKALASYLRETRAAESLYYLGAALYAHGEALRAQEVWRLLLFFPTTELFRERARRQLLSPFVEPLLLPQE